MRTLIIAALVSLGLAGCVPAHHVPHPDTAAQLGEVIDSTGANAPAPLGRTSADEKVIIGLLSSADAIATAVDTLRDLGKLVPGTPKALAVREALIRLRSFIAAASAAQRAGNATSYEEALRQVAIAAREVADAIANL